MNILHSIFVYYYIVLDCNLSIYITFQFMCVHVCVWCACKWVLRVCVCMCLCVSVSVSLHIYVFYACCTPLCLPANFVLILIPRSTFLKQQQELGNNALSWSRPRVLWVSKQHCTWSTLQMRPLSPGHCSARCHLLYTSGKLVLSWC